MRHVIMSDRMLTDLLSRIMARPVGIGEEEHPHWSILTIDGDVVVDVDWGYHSEDEARSWSKT